MPVADDGWTPSAVAHAGLVKRLRARGHSPASIKVASDAGRLAFGYVESLFHDDEELVTLAEASARTGLDEDLIDRIWDAVGMPHDGEPKFHPDDIEALGEMAGALEAGFPLVAFLQAIRVYGQALRQLADAEARLFHLYVHEPLMESGRTGLEIAEEMRDMAGKLMPRMSEVIEFLHRKHLRRFLEHDVISHVESDLGESDDAGRIRVAMAFVDLAGYTRFTEEEGEEEAVGLVETFVSNVEATLPTDVRVVKLMGDGVMLVGTDPVSLTEWAVGFQELSPDRPRPRIGIHVGRPIYRDGDYFGSDVNLAARVTARALGGELLVTETVRDAASERSPQLEFDPIGAVRLKGFQDEIELYRVLLK